MASFWSFTRTTPQRVPLDDSSRRAGSCVVRAEPEAAPNSQSQEGTTDETNAYPRRPGHRARRTARGACRRRYSTVKRPGDDGDLRQPGSGRYEEQRESQPRRREKREALPALRLRDAQILDDPARERRASARVRSAVRSQPHAVTADRTAGSCTGRDAVRFSLLLPAVATGAGPPIGLRFHSRVRRR